MSSVVNLCLNIAMTMENKDVSPTWLFLIGFCCSLINNVLLLLFLRVRRFSQLWNDAARFNVLLSYRQVWKEHGTVGKNIIYPAFHLDLLLTTKLCSNQQMLIIHMLVHCFLLKPVMIYSYESSCNGPDHYSFGSCSVIKPRIHSCYALSTSACFLVYPLASVKVL